MAHSLRYTVRCSREGLAARAALAVTARTKMRMGGSGSHCEETERDGSWRLCLPLSSRSFGLGLHKEQAKALQRALEADCQESKTTLKKKKKKVD